MDAIDFEVIGRFIYATQRAGVSDEDLANWLADAVGEPRSPEANVPDLLAKLTVAYPDRIALQEKLASYIDTLKGRA